MINKYFKLSQKERRNVYTSHICVCVERERVS